MSDAGNPARIAETTDPLRVLMVTTSYPRRDGDFAGHFVRSLAQEIAALGHAVTVLAPHAAGLAEAESDGAVSVRRFRYASDAFERVAYGDGIPVNVRRDWRAAAALPAFARGLRRAVRSLAPDADVIHAQWAPTAALAGAALAGRPVVLTTHGSDTTLARKGGVWKQLLVAGLAHTRRVIAVSAEQVGILRSAGLWSGPVDVLPSGVPAELAQRPRPPRAADGSCIFVFAGRLVTSKGVGELLEAFILTAATRPAARLTLAGDGPEDGALRERATAAGVADRVTFLGRVDHDRVLDVIAAADAFVLASHGEGSPVSVTEALALGTPVAGTRVGAMPELLGDDGLLVDVGDVPALAAAMGRLADEPELRERLSSAGRERIRERYTWPSLAAATVRVYREAIHG